MTLGNLRISKEEFETVRSLQLKKCDKMDEAEFVPEELYKADKIRLSKTENQGEIIVGENKDGSTSFIYSEKNASLKTYSYEGGLMTKHEYLDNRAILEEMEYKDIGCYPTISPHHISKKAKSILEGMEKDLKNEKYKNLMSLEMLNKLKNSR